MKRYRTDTDILERIKNKERKEIKVKYTNINNKTIY